MGFRWIFKIITLGGISMNIEVKDGVYTFKGVDTKFSFRTNLSAVKKISFVNSVTDYIVGDNYNSVIHDLMFDFEIIEIFTDVDLTEIRESSDSLSKIEEFLSETKVVDIVKANMADGLLQELNRAVDDNISYRTGVQCNHLTNALSNLIETIDKKIKGIDTDSLMEVAQKLNDMNGDLTPDSILEAYANSELYKKTAEETKKQKKQQKEFMKNVAKILGR